MSECTCSCSCETSKEGPRLVLSCSGGSNVGQIANSAAIALDQQGKAQMYCLVGIAAHISGMVDAAKSASAIIAIDGCQVACARRALEHMEIPITQHIDVTALGIQKKHRFEWTPEELQTVIQSVE